MHCESNLGRCLGRALALWLFVALASSATAAKPGDVLRVCADGNYMPYSNFAGNGFENRIAEVLGKDLGLTVEYEWFPQRMGFIRNTLRAQDPATGDYKCDLVMGVPDDFELAITTKPYYRSTYALVLVEGRGLDDVETPRDLVAMAPERRQKLRIGMHERNPGVAWLNKHGMLEQLVPYVAQLGDPEVGPGQLEADDLLAGRLDAAILWGPLAGYAAKRAEGATVRVIPLPTEAGVKFDYAISAAVRFGEKDWKNTVEDALQRNSAEIKAILADFKVPLLPE